MKSNPTINIALIPARSGSKRLPGKNIKLLNDKPLIAYTVCAAKKTGLFSEVIVSTDSEEIAQISRQWGASVPSLRPGKFATDESTDIDWVLHAVNQMISRPLGEVKHVAILRPTSPLRSGESIVRAMENLESCIWADSIRALEPTFKHPGKMWLLDENHHAKPYLDQEIGQVPTYNKPTQMLEKLWIQNASLEIVKLKSLLASQKISGEKVLGIELPGFEGFDLNTSHDWDFLEFIASKYPDVIPRI
jgi:N-acylneuraminate cytidylyltransferase